MNQPVWVFEPGVTAPVAVLTRTLLRTGLGNLVAAHPLSIAAISGYYAQGGEVNRLEVGRGRLEFLRTQDVLRRLLPPGPARVLDVGGGAGAHARWLAADGYQVRLVDPMPLHVQHASGIAGVDAVLGDARRLTEPDARYHATLLLGPLYHLPERRDRVTALREAACVTAPGGIVAAATICRYAGLYDTLVRGCYLAYFHHPDEIVDEFAEAGLTTVTRYALEGGAWLFADRDGWLDGDERTTALLDALRCVEREPSLFGITAHLLTAAVVR